MCGISLIINKTSNPLSKGCVQTFNQVINHRGPDDEGYYNEGVVNLGHRRLSILDLSEAGHQPMHYKDQFVISYNGEIYNYIELREKLKLLGHQFQTQTDTEVILAAYAHWGEDCVSHFNGMWGFVIHDRLKNKIFISRDRFGVKPVYYFHNTQYFLAASEIRQLLTLTPPEINFEMMADFLVTGMLEHTNQTFFKHILKLPGGHNLSYDISTHSFSINKWYEIHKTSNPTNVSHEKILFDAVKLRLRSDVPVGTCLSGGLDSSTIAAMAAKQHQEKSSTAFMGIHAQSEDSTSDESGFAKKVADYAKLDLRITKPTMPNFESVIEELLKVQEEPFVTTSIIMQYEVMRKAKSEGIKVLLDGQGGDETLLGYEKYYPLVLWWYLKHKGIKVFLQELIMSFQNNSKINFKAYIKYAGGMFFSSLRILIHKWEARNLSSELLNHNFSHLKELSQKSLKLFDLQVHELFFTNLPSLLRYEDKNSMAFSIETRLPFLDYRHVEYALNLPVDQKIKHGWSKWILRQSAESYLPFDIIWRKNKFGFLSPEEKWLNDNKEHILNFINSHPKRDYLLKNKINSKKITRFIWRVYLSLKWIDVWEVELS